MSEAYRWAHAVKQPEKQKSALIVEEFKRCGVISCADMILPVRWAGAMPEPNAQVRLDGAARKGSDGLEFVANSLETVPHRSTNC